MSALQALFPEAVCEGACREKGSHQTSRGDVLLRLEEGPRLLRGYGGLLHPGEPQFCHGRNEDRGRESLRGGHERPTDAMALLQSGERGREPREVPTTGLLSPHSWCHPTSVPPQLCGAAWWEWEEAGGSGLAEGLCLDAHRQGEPEFGDMWTGQIRAKFWPCQGSCPLRQLSKAVDQPPPSLPGGLSGVCI